MPQPALSGRSVPDRRWLGAEGGRLAGNRCTEIPPRAERHGGGNPRQRISGRAMACTFVCEKDSAFPAAPGLAAEGERCTVVLRLQLERLLCAGHRQPGRAGLSAPGVRPGAERLGFRPCQAGFSVRCCPLWHAATSRAAGCTVLWSFCAHGAGKSRFSAAAYR